MQEILLSFGSGEILTSPEGKRIVCYWGIVCEIIIKKGA